MAWHRYLLDSTYRVYLFCVRWVWLLLVLLLCIKVVARIPFNLLALPSRQYSNPSLCISSESQNRTTYTKINRTLSVLRSTYNTRHGHLFVSLLHSLCFISRSLSHFHLHALSFCPVQRSAFVLTLYFHLYAVLIIKKQPKRKREMLDVKKIQLI